MDYLGWDIGGVHLKLSVLRAGGGGADLRSGIVPFEIWRDPRALEGRLRSMLREARARGEGRAERVAETEHGVTMTAELSDVFSSRAEGVRAVLRACAAALDDGPIRVLDRDGRLLAPAEAMERPLAVAAANWVATARLAARLAWPAILIDVGSTTTDIVALADGHPRPAGMTDTARLMSGELVYTGLLRTPLSSLAGRVPLRGCFCRVSPEHFTITGDVYRVLGRIRESEYTVPTPDGRGKGIRESATRLARLVCADPGDLGEEEILGIARFLEGRQIDRIADAVRQVLSRLPDAAPAEAIVAGVGGFLAEEAAARAGLGSRRLAALLPSVSGGAWDVAAPSAALALLLAERDGRIALR